MTAGILAVGLFGIANLAGNAWAATASSTANALTTTSQTSAQSVSTAGHANVLPPFGSTSAAGTDRINSATDAASGLTPVCASGANAGTGTCSSTR
jgi:hypothetical protein